ncbi:MAG TPA: YggS family pyridoxal phosphate-dependent enzyme, partial [Pirellulales bacterium]|nr:YggS family pyridoxal phosphate-dependent enzyme [Pirellulales bacterium]
MPPELSSDQRRRLAQNLADVHGRIAEAAARCGRAPAEVKLVAVTKYVDATTTRTLVDQGCRALGESRPQDLWRKAEALADMPIEWHMIGHLQRNKVERTMACVGWLHSGDSLRLLEAVDQQCAKIGRRLPVLIEVNVSGDASKHGFAPDDVEPNLESLAKLKQVEVRGLMAMARREGDTNAARHDFARLRVLREQLAQVSPPEFHWNE